MFRAKAWLVVWYFAAVAIICAVSWLAAPTVAFLPLSLRAHGSVRAHTRNGRVAYYSKKWKHAVSCLDTVSDTAAGIDIVTCMEQVHQRVQANDTSPISVKGTVTAKRAFGSSFGFVDIATSNGAEIIVQLMIKRQNYHGEMGGLLKGINLGMLLRITGVASETRNPGEGVVLVHSCEILSLPANPQHVRGLLRLVSQNKLIASQIARAANTTAAILNKQIQTASQYDGDDFDALAKELLSWPSTKKQRLATKSTARETNQDSSGKRSFPAVPLHLREPPLSLSDLNSTHSVEPLLVESVSDFQQQRHDDGRLVSVVAWAQNRRRFSDSVAVVKVGDTFVAVSKSDSTPTLNDNGRLQCVLHPTLLGEDVANVYGNLLAGGSKLRLEGYLWFALENETRPTMWVTHVELLRCSWRPMIVRFLIELVVQDKFDVEEAANALRIDLLQSKQLSQLDLTERQWKANEISQTFQDSQTRTAHVSSEMMEALESFEGLRDDYPTVQDDGGMETLQSSDSESRSIQGNGLLATNVAGTWWQRKKRPQLEFMGKQIQDVVRSHPDFGTRQLRILDVGGGKGVLANYLVELLGDAVQVQVIDVAAGAVKNGMMRSKRMSLPVEFVLGDASKHEENVDVVVALHACGALSDVALGHAVIHAANFVVCPCCFRSNPHLGVPVEDEGDIARTFQSPHDWLGVEASKFDMIKRIAEVQGDADLASKGMHAICAMRADAIRRKLDEQNVKLDVTIKTFPVSFSTRNYCLVGKVQ